MLLQRTEFTPILENNKCLHVHVVLIRKLIRDSTLYKITPFYTLGKQSCVGKVSLS